MTIGIDPLADVQRNISGDAPSDQAAPTAVLSAGRELTAIGPATNGLSPWRSLKTSFLTITLSSVLVILIAFFAYLETTQYRVAENQITDKLNRMLDSGSILLADATARKNDDEILLLLAPVLGDPDVVAVAVDLSDGSRLAVYGDPFAAIDKQLVMRRAITHAHNGIPGRIGTLLVGLTHKRIKRDLEERLRNDFILALLIFSAIVVSSYQSLQMTVMRPMRKLLAAIEGWEIDNHHRPVAWERNDEFGQLISSFNQMQHRQQYYQDSLRVARDSAESADRVKTAFLAIIGHELRTPLNAIIGFSDLLKNKLANSPDGEYADHIYDSGHALLAMVNDILEITHAQAGKLNLVPEAVALPALVGQVVERCCAAKSGAAARVEIMVPDTCPIIQADPATLGRVVMHLVDNALRFTPKDGKIRVEVAFDEKEICLMVGDTGCGIPEDRLADLQGAFVQLASDWRNHSEGTGLGLTYVRTMVQKFGGVFTLDSVAGEGTTAKLTFPL